MRQRKSVIKEAGLITEYTGSEIELENQDLELMTEEALLEDSQNPQISKEIKK